MTSINKLWPTFNIETGLIEEPEFKTVMVQVAQEHGLYNGTDEEVEQTTVFFTNENLTNIFEQIVAHESK